MSYRIIDSDNYKDSGIETLIFPGGEPHAKLPLFEGDILFVLKTRSLQDTMFGACVWDALSRQKKVNPKLFIPYFPGARQDRSPYGEAPVTKNLMDAWFGSETTHTFDLHSNKASYTGFVHMPCDLNIPVKEDVVGIIAPDEGAEDRADQFRWKFYPGTPLVIGRKTRDSRTGALSGYQLPDIPERGKYIIVDDICDGGGTFNLLAEAFFKAKKGSGSRLELFVSHGIFSKGIGAIDQRIDHITTTNSWYWPGKFSNVESKRVSCLYLGDLYDKIMGVE